MGKYQQQKEAGVEASRHQESFEGNSAVRIDIPDHTKFSPAGKKEMKTSSSSIALGFALMELEKCSGVTNSATSDMKYRLEVLSRVEGSSSKIETVASEVQATTRPTVRVQERSEDKHSTLLKEGIAIDPDAPLPAWWESNEIDIFQQKTPLGDTMLHIAATFHYYVERAWLDMVAEKAPQLLTAKNSNGDMALHAAARAGKITFLKYLIAVHFRNVKLSDPESLQEALNEVLTGNKPGNTFIHEALVSGEKYVLYFLSSMEDMRLPIAYQDMVMLAALFRTNNQKKSILYLAIEAGYKECVEAILTKLANSTSLYDLIVGFPGFDKVFQPHLYPDVPTGKSPLLAAIVKQDKEILDLILKKKPAWVASRDTDGRTPLHYAASVGYLNGVQYLLSKCASCATERDNHGYFPVHLASDGGHVEVDMNYRSEILSREMLIEGSSSKIEADYQVTDSVVLDMKYRSEMHSIEMLTEESSSEIETDATQVQATRQTVRVQEHSEDKNPTLLKDAYLLIKAGITSGSARWERVTNETGIFQQKSPLGNTVLHLAAAYSGNSAWVGKVAEKAPQLLTAKNSNDDMALHVAAAAGNICFLKNLLDVHLRHVNFSDPECLQKALNEILTKNKLGNTFIHEALLNGHKDVMCVLSSKEDTPLPLAYKEMVALAASFQTNNQNKSILHLAIEAGYKEAADEILTKLANPTLLNKLMEGLPGFDEVIPHNLDPKVPTGESPLLAAIMKQDREILDLILKKKPSWVTLRDTEGRTPLHYAASIGYLYGVQFLLYERVSCATERDNHGYFPLHLASDGGHVEVVKELLKPKYCLNPRELLDNGGRNFLHLAVASGKFNIVRFVLKSTDNELGEMINDQDANGNTPLHLATLRCHPKIVQALTWDRRVKLNLVNEVNQTALDVCTQTSLQNPSLRQRLTWLALKSAGVPYADPLACSIKVPSRRTENLWKKEAPNMDQYKDRFNIPLLVSTLIITVTFAAGFTLPGGAKSSDPGQGMALMLHRMLFKVFIFCITISMYGGISVTIILIWAQLGDLTMAILALNVAKYCLGVILATLSLAFLAGVHLVISDLSWLATTTLIMSITFIIMLLLLYTLLWLPSTSSKSIVRLISYYPFLMLASLAEGQ